MSQQNDIPRDEFAIWKNTRKESDRHPDFTGSATINGVEYWVSAWKRGPDANPKSPALKGQFRRKEQKPEQQAETKPAGFNDDIPF